MKNLSVFPCLAAAFAAAVLTGHLLFDGHAAEEANPKNIEKIRDALPRKAPGKANAMRRVLVFSKTNGFRHGSIKTGVPAIKLLGEKTGAFQVVATEDESYFEPDKLKEFDAVVMLNTTGEVFRPKKLPADKDEKEEALEREERLKKSLVDFVRNGGGLAGMHAATDTYKRWKEYNEMMGGAFAGHPWHQKVRIKNLAPGHVLTKSFDRRGFDITDEIYQFREDTASPRDRRILLALDGDGTDLKKGKYGENGLYPISWARTYGKGRTFYCSLGHRDEIYWNPEVLEHYLAGIQYVLGDLEADATPKP